MRHIFSFLCTLVTLSFVASVSAQAEEKQSVLPPEVAQSKAAQDAVGGVVKEEPEWQDVYDVYSRQLAFREKTKAFRESLTKRQEAFAEPSADLIEKYKENVSYVYEQEHKAQQKKDDKKKQSSPFSPSSMSMEPKKPSEKHDDHDTAMPSKDLEPKEEKVAQGNDMPHVKEVDIPAPPGEVLDVKRKVVTEEDAPEFDPSKL